MKEFILRCGHVLFVITAIALWLTISQQVFAEQTGIVTGSRPGKLIDIGTHRLHVTCVGEGEPTVVLDAGLGGLSIEWDQTQQLLARHVKICAYDRAGYGWSDTGPSPRTSSRNANELYALLQTAGLPGPYILVGHSYEGYNVQLFASRYPHATAGLILVDSSHSDQVQRFLAPPIRLNTAPSSSRGTVRFSLPKLPAGLPEHLKPTGKNEWLMLPIL